MGRKVALLIGVGQYGAGLKALNCPANGVEAMRSLLENPDIGEFDQVIPLIDPNSGEMRARIGETFADLSKEDLVLLYFTGHGIKDSYGKFYLTATESYLFENGDINPGTAVESGFVKDTIYRCWAERKVVILDCCFAAAFADGFIGMDGENVDIAAQLSTKELGEKGCCVLTASTSTRYALEPEGEELSVYTRYLTEGLRTGGAALDGQRFISARHLHDYVRSQIKVAAPAMQPAIFNALEGDGIAIAKVHIDNEQRYRKQVQAIVKQLNGKLRPSARGNLKLSQNELGISDEQAAEILAEVLKPYQENTKHVKFYRQMLTEEKEYSYPLDAEAVEQLKNIKRRLNLRDADVLAVENNLLGSSLSAAVSTATTSVSEVTAPTIESKSQTPLRHHIFSFETVRVNEQGQVVKEMQREAEYYTEDLGNSVTIEMVRIPSGKFLMGAAKGEKGAYDSEYPQHEVNLLEFWMSKYAVTQLQWRAVAAFKKVERDLKSNPAKFKGNQRPVEQVSWGEAVEFCARLSQHTKRQYALPSEAQWEYACRAGTKTPFHFGPTITTDLANYDGGDFILGGKTYPGNYRKGPKGAYRQTTTDIASFPPNNFGLYDMHGNVWEWCLDGWHVNYHNAPTDGTEWKSSNGEKVLRGGSWNLNPTDCRAADRNWYASVNRLNSIGFRVVSVASRT